MLYSKVEAVRKEKFQSRHWNRWPRLETPFFRTAFLFAFHSRIELSKSGQIFPPVRPMIQTGYLEK